VLFASGCSFFPKEYRLGQDEFCMIYAPIPLTNPDIAALSADAARTIVKNEQKYSDLCVERR